ncbi:MAG: peroxidase [Planctomycetes bacterium]|nr:peroxidase [Planctomycetota bacterium]
MAYIRQVEVAHATGALKRQYDAGIRRAGKVFNILKIQSLTPDMMGDGMRFYLTIMRGPGPLEPWQREMLATAVSRANHCFY